MSGHFVLLYYSFKVLYGVPIILLQFFKKLTFCLQHHDIIIVLRIYSRPFYYVYTQPIKVEQYYIPRLKKYIDLTKHWSAFYLIFFQFFLYCWYNTRLMFTVVGIGIKHIICDRSKFRITLSGGTCLLGVFDRVWRNHGRR